MTFRDRYARRLKRVLRLSPFVLSIAMRLTRQLKRERARTGGTDTGAYCYSVWMRHLVHASDGASAPPRCVVELGPGDSIGIGLAALLSGADTYYALDASRYADAERSLRVFDELVELFQRRAEIPSGGALVDVKPALPSYAFPAHVLTEDRLRSALAPARLDAIRRAIERMNEPFVAEGPVKIAYFAPWDRRSVPAGSADLVLSQAVLEHVRDLPGVYHAMAEWCRPGGGISHQIDLRSHGTAPAWNGHWVYSEKDWERVENPQVYRTINRYPASVHLQLLEDQGFAVRTTVRAQKHTGIFRSEPAPRWRFLTDDDLTCSGLYVLAEKRR